MLLGACSTLGLGSHTKEKSNPPSEFAKLAEANQEMETIQASYHSPGNTVYDLPDAQDYSMYENRQWVNELDTAPEWQRTPEEWNPPLYQDPISPPVPQELESDDSAEEQVQQEQEPNDSDREIA